MNTVDEVFSAFGGPTAFARAIGIKISAASEMRRRKSIPVDYWKDLVAAAEEGGISGISYESLVTIHTPERERVAS